MINPCHVNLEIQEEQDINKWHLVSKEFPAVKGSYTLQQTYQIVD